MYDAKEEIRDRLAIEDVVSDYVELRRAGRNFKALSPFSSEKTPSFIVSPDKRIWHDFSSGKGGDIFGFVMEMEGVDFKEALKILARKAGVELKLYNNQNSQALAHKKQRLTEINQLSMKFYQAIMLKNPHALDYAIKQRGLATQTLKDFGIGYAPNHERALVDFLTKRNYKIDEIIEAGLTNRFKGDLFRARLMIPLSDAMGQAIGFTGRGLTPEATPKYLNTPATILYDKSRHVFGLFQAKESIRKLNQAVIVEGNMDVISSHQVDIKQVVATAGTAMTIQHLKTLSRYTSDIRLAFDADKAGINATERAISLAQEAGVDLKVISLSHNAKDPDELIQQDSKYWQQAIDEAIPVVDWLIKIYAERLDLTTAIGKRDFTKQIFKIIRQIHHEVERESYLQQIAKMLHISLDVIKNQFADNQITPKRLKRSNPNREVELDLYQDDLLAIALINSQIRKQIAPLAELLTNTDNKPRRKLANLLTKPNFDFKMIEGLHDLAIYVKILTLKTDEHYSKWSKNEIIKEGERLIERSERDLLKQRTELLRQQLEQAELSGDDVEVKRLLTAINQSNKGEIDAKKRQKTN